MAEQRQHSHTYIQNQPQTSGSTESVQITLHIDPNLWQRLQVAAITQQQTIEAFLQEILTSTLPEEPEPDDTHTNPLTSQEMIERLRRLRTHIFHENNGQLFENSTNIIRHMREERTRHIEHVVRGNNEQ